MRLRPSFRVEQIHPDTLDYRSRLISNGGTINDSDLTAVDVFVKEVYGNGLRSLLLDVSPLAGNNLAAALTKLWHPTGVQSNLTNTGFLEVDYSRSTGLQGNGSTKSLNTGLIPSTFISSSSSSIGMYNRTDTAGTHCEISACNADYSQSLNLFAKFNDNNAYFDNYNITNGQGRLTVNAIANPRGLWIGSRTANNLSSLYLNGILQGSTSTSGGSVPSTQSVRYFALNTNGTLNTHSAKTAGLFFIGLGLLQSQVATLYRLTQNLMSAFGRQV